MLDEATAVELVLDITDQKVAEQAMRDSEARLRSLVEGIPQLVFRSHASGQRIWGSPQWVAYTGLSEQESLGLGWLDAISPRRSRCDNGSLGGSRRAPHTARPGQDVPLVPEPCNAGAGRRWPQHRMVRHVD
jgi:PAS domain-containing protein